jgi:tetratricopeptide (TPR) repeat protein
LSLPLLVLSARPAAADEVVTPDAGPFLFVTSIADPEVARQEREVRQIPRVVEPARSAVVSATSLATLDRTGEARKQLELALAHDPDNPQAHMARIRVAPTDPAVLGDAIGDAARAATRGFPNQIVLALNVFLVTLWSISLGVVGTAGAIVFRYVRHVHHSLQESFSGRLGGGAPVVAVGVILIPALWGLGLIPTLVFFLLWFGPILRPSEKNLAYAVGAVGAVLWLTHVVSPGPLGAPGPDHGPFRVAQVFESGGSPGFHDDLDIDGMPGHAAWARGMAAKRTGDLATAESELQVALQLLPNHPPLLVDLGNVHFLQGRLREARSRYEAAAVRDPNLAEPEYNRAQVLNEELDFLGSTDAMSLASQKDGFRVATFGDSPAGKLARPAMDMLPGSGTFWQATLRGQGIHSQLPIAAGLEILSPGGRILYMPVALAVLYILGMLAGQWLHRSVKTYSCRSCGKIVCRRCLVRVDGSPYCQDCGQTLSASFSAEYSKALLDRYFKKRYTPRSVLSNLMRWLLPGWAEVSSWSAARSVTVLSLCGGALMALSLPGLPVSGAPSGASPGMPAPLTWLLAIALYGAARLVTWRWRSDPPDPLDLANEDAEYRAAS